MSDGDDPNPALCDSVAHNAKGARGSTAKDARAQRSSAALREALLRLLDRRSFDQITVRDICAESGVHYATFFRHHASKQAILDHIAADQIEELVTLTLPIREAGDEAGSFGALCDFVADHWSLWSILLNGGAGPAMRSEWLRRAREVAERTEPVANWLPKELGIICSTTLIADTISWWLDQPRGTISSSEISRILSRLVSSSTLSAD